MIKFFFCLIFFLLFPGLALIAQMDSAQQLLFNQIYLAAEKEYGIDQGLVNGPLFENENQNVNGLPFLLNYYSNHGNVVYRGKQYSNLNLRYDIYQQELLLIYLFDSVEYEIQLQKEFVSEFEIENRKFINQAFGADGDAKFYQLIGQDLPISVLYFWHKGLSNVYVNNPDIKMFSPEQKDQFILINHKLVGYKGNKSFIRGLPSERKPAIKEFLRRNNTNVKQAKDHEMNRLIKFINTIEN